MLTMIYSNYVDDKDDDDDDVDDDDNYASQDLHGAYIIQAYYYSLLLRTLIERKYTPVFNAYVVLLCKFVFYLRHSLCERKVNADRVESSFLFAQTRSLSIIHRKLYTIRRCCIESIGAEF